MTSPPFVDALTRCGWPATETRPGVWEARCPRCGTGRLTLDGDPLTDPDALTCSGGCGAGEVIFIVEAFVRRRSKDAKPAPKFGVRDPRFPNPPRPLAVEMLPVPRFDPNLLPAAFRGWVMDMARRISCPPEYPAVAAVVALSAVVGRRVALRPKRHDDWTIIPNLWGAVVGSPGTLKSPAVAEALKPLQRLEAKARQEFEDAKEIYDADAMADKATADAAKRELGKAAKRGESREALRAMAMEAQSADADKPTRARYIVNDCTVEKLGEILAENQFGVLMNRDELTGFFHGLNKPGRESDRGFYLTAWNGDSSYPYDRIGRGTIDIDAACVSLFGTIQPGPLAAFLRGAAAGEEADGFASRLQMMVYPDPPGKFINVDRYPDAGAKAAAFAVFERLATLTAGDAGAQEEKDEVPFLRFDADAQEFFDEWRERLENRLRCGSLSPLMEMHLSKYRSLMPSLALLLTLADGGCLRDVGGGCVPCAAARAAAAWCDFLEAHARRIYHAATEGETQSAATLGERIRAGKLPNPFTFRDVHQKAWSGLTRPEQADTALSRLIECGWIAEEDVTPQEKGGRPTTIYHTNPALWEKKKNAPYAGTGNPQNPQNPEKGGFEGDVTGEYEEFSHTDAAPFAEDE